MSSNVLHMSEALHWPREGRKVIRKGAYSLFQEARMGTRMRCNFADGRFITLDLLKLDCTEYDPDNGLLLRFLAQEVLINGINLVEIANAIDDRFCAELYVKHRSHRLLPDDPHERDDAAREPYIERIVISGS